MLPDPASVLARRAAEPRPPAPPRPVELGEEPRAALRDAADKAGDPTLVPTLERLVVVYTQARATAASAPRLGALHEKLRRCARQLESARLALAPDPWSAAQLGEVAAAVDPDLEHVDWALSEMARRARVAAGRIEPGDRRLADRTPGSPRWRLLWELADLWSARGRKVGIGQDTAFYSFGSDVFRAAGETLPVRVANELAEVWQRRAPNLTAGTPESAGA